MAINASMTAIAIPAFAPVDRSLVSPALRLVDEDVDVVLGWDEGAAAEYWVDELELEDEVVVVEEDGRAAVAAGLVGVIITVTVVMPAAVGVVVGMVAEAASAVADVAYLISVLVL